MGKRMPVLWTQVPQAPGRGGEHKDQLKRCSGQQGLETGTSQSQLRGSHWSGVIRSHQVESIGAGPGQFAGGHPSDQALVSPESCCFLAPPVRAEGCSLEAQGPAAKSAGSKHLQSWGWGGEAPHQRRRRPPGTYVLPIGDSQNGRCSGQRGPSP